MDWNKEYFYHYTSFESAIKIIASRTLLFSDIKRLNDITHKYIRIKTDELVLKYEKEGYSVRLVKNL